MVDGTQNHGPHGPREPLAVVGMAGVYPEAVGIPAYWRLLVSGRDAVTEVPPERWSKEDYYAEDARGADKTYSVRGAFLPGVAFDPVAFGIPPALLSATDVTQLLALVVARDALEDATGGDLQRLDRETTSVILGTSQQNELGGMMAARGVRPIWEKAMLEHGLSPDAARVIADRITEHFVGWQESTFPGMLANIVAGRVANRFDLGGTNLTVDAACASSLAALGVAADELRLGRATLALTGGVDVTNSAVGFICFSQTPALSPTGAIRPFDEEADGTLLGEGVGILAVKRLSDAEEAGDRIYAVIRGIGTSSDGRANSIYAPHAAGQERAFRRAYEEAGISPGTVELLEAHATATRVGDAVELESSSRVFEGSGRTDRQWCGIGSVKSQIAHTKCAAGVAGLTKVILGLTQRVIPPTVNVERPNPRFDFPRSPFYTPTRARPWFSSQDHPRRAAVSAFGFGGTNAHVVVEEYRGPGARTHRIPAFPVHLLAVSGADRPSAATAARALAGALGAAPDELADLAVASVRGVDPDLPGRIAVVAATADEARTRLLDAAGRLEAGEDGRGPGSAWGCGGDPGPVAFLFPGQGSQHLDMGIDLAIHFDAAREAFELGNDLVPGTPLHRVIMPPPTFDAATRAEQEARLTATEWAQPAIGATSLALLAVLEQVGLQPDAAAGHSFGEWTALCAAGALTPGELLRLARIRGEAVRDAAATSDGAMVAVRGTRGEVEEMIEDSPDLVLANLNAPRQQVVAGPRVAVEALEARLGEAGLDFRRLAVATAFHSPLVAAATGPVASSLAQSAIAPPRIPVYANVTARPHPSGADEVRALLARQITAPVRFAEIVEALWSDGIRTFVEVGPGQTLTGLVGAGLGDRPHRAVALHRPGRDGITSLFEALAQLFAAGVRLDLPGLFRGYTEAPATRRSTSPVTVILDGGVVGRPWPPPRGEAGPPPCQPPSPPHRRSSRKRRRPYS
jgi:polyketide-type polyunsaturated fatty acid synthase PfaA